jgi:hypothetical protein
MFNMYFHLNTGSIYTRLTVWLIKDHDCKKWWAITAWLARHRLSDYSKTIILNY